MTKSNGRKAVKLKGFMRSDGTVHVSGPNIFGRLKGGKEVIFRDEKTGLEVSICLKEGKEDKIIKFEPFVNMMDADVEVFSLDPPSEFHDSLDLQFKDGHGQEFDFAFSEEQARIICRKLLDYVSARDAWKNVGVRKVGKAAPNEY